MGDFAGHFDQRRFFDKGTQATSAKLVGFAPDTLHLQIHIFAGFGFDVGVADLVGGQRAPAAGFAELTHSFWRT